MYCSGCIFVDHASSSVHLEFQLHLTTHETLKAKEQYELFSRNLGINVQSFLTDNESAFISNEFNSQLAKFEQVIRFAGTGAHHHNAIAKRNIQTIMAIARTMMLYLAFHWSDLADSFLWPMAVQHAVFLHITCQVKRQAYLLLTYLPEVDGSSGNFMTCMFGDALSTVLKRTYMTARSCLSGSLGPIVP